MVDSNSTPISLTCQRKPSYRLLTKMSNGGHLGHLHLVSLVVVPFSLGRAIPSIGQISEDQGASVITRIVHEGSNAPLLRCLLETYGSTTPFPDQTVPQLQVLCHQRLFKKNLEYLSKLSSCPDRSLLFRFLFFRSSSSCYCIDHCHMLL